MRGTLLIGCATAALAGCSEQSVNDAAATPANGQGATVTLQPGQWEARIEILNMTAPNMPRGMTPPRMPARTVSQCLSAEQAARPNAGVMMGNSNQVGCTTENYSVAGGRIQGAISCDIQGARTRTTLDGHFTATDYDMIVQAEANVGNMITNTETRITARRTGDCRR